MNSAYDFIKNWAQNWIDSRFRGSSSSYSRYPLHMAMHSEHSSFDLLHSASFHTILSHLALLAWPDSFCLLWLIIEFRYQTKCIFVYLSCLRLSFSHSWLYRDENKVYLVLTLSSTLCSLGVVYQHSLLSVTALLSCCWYCKQTNKQLTRRKAR